MAINIPFNKAPVLGTELAYIQQAIDSASLAGDGNFSRKCEALLESITLSQKVLLMPSCTAALEASALLVDIRPGDEVIMPSYTFVSTANAFALRGAKVVFVDIVENTMNISPEAIKRAITSKTKAIVVVHYAGVACDMDEIMLLARENDLFVIEDAAQAIGSHYKGKALGTIGHLGAYSFHETKNITSGGEGGALLINTPSLVERAEIIREKGTNRKSFLRGSIDKYSWVDIGSSFLPSEIQSAYLFAQLQCLERINSARVECWELYSELLSPLESSGHIRLPVIPPDSGNNAHMFYIKCRSVEQRSELISYMKSKGVLAVFHYVPLHSSSFGLKNTDFCGVDRYTTIESEKLIRLPIFYGLTVEETHYICQQVIDFYQ
ncbi:dTDP-4-amino-4,6-dideoxygalactose transaminase [Marinomonas epiphytica]